MQFIYYILFFVTPLIVLPFTSELFEFNKLVLIYLLAFSAICLSIYNGIKDGKIILRRTFLDIPILLFLSSQILSTVFSIDRHTSLFGYYGRFNGGLVSLISYLVLFYIFASNFKEKMIDKILKTSLLSSSVVVLWGLPGKLGFDLSCLVFLGQLNNSCWSDQFRPAERMFSTIGQPNWLAAYLCINFFIGFYLFLKNKKMWPYGYYLILNLAGILFTRSRSAYIAIFIVLMVLLSYILIFLKDEKKNLRTLLPKFRNIAIAFIAMILVFKTGINSIDRITNFKFLISNKAQITQTARQPQAPTDVTESGDIRKIVWRGAWDLGFKYPIFGTGVETFAYSYYFVRPREHNLTSEWDFLYNKAHNEFLNYFATSGFLGIGSYIIFIAGVYLLAFKTLKQSSDKLLILCLAAAWTTILITNFFGFATTTVSTIFYLIPAFLIVMHRGHEKYIELVIKHRKTAVIVASAIGFYMILFIINYFRGDIYYAKAESFVSAGDPQNAVSYYGSALKSHYEHVYQDKLSASLVSLALIIPADSGRDTMGKLIETSDIYNKLSLKASNQNVLYWKTRSKNNYYYYQITNDKKYLAKSLDALMVSERLSPTDPKIFYTSSIVYSLMSDIEIDKKKIVEYRKLALEKISRSISLKSNYSEGYLLRAQLYMKEGDLDRAKQDLVHALKLNPNDEEAKRALEDLKK